MFDKDSLICGKESAADNYAKGRYTLGREFINPVVKSLRSLSENCSSLQGFMITHSIGGGTGSGFTSLLLEKMNNQFCNKSKSEVQKDQAIFGSYIGSYIGSFKDLNLYLGS